MKNKLLKFMAILCMLTNVMFSVSCNKVDSKVIFNDENGQLTIENNAIRFIFDKASGAIRNIYNKDKELTFTNNNGEDVLPIRLAIIDDYQTKNILHTSFSYTATDIEKGKALHFEWSFESGQIVLINFELLNNSDEGSFTIEVKNNDLSKPIESVEYPIIEQIKSLVKEADDYFVSPFVTGYLFNNPCKFFNLSGSYPGITKDYGFYPSGWQNPMQFQAFYSQNKGGFYMVCEDGNADITCKSLTFSGSGNRTCRSSIWHYMSDLGKTNITLNYKTKIANLYEGNWYEAAEKYKVWATKQSWCTDRNKKIDRTNIHKKFYEQTSLCMFCLLNFPGYTVDIYNKAKEYVDGHYIFMALNGSTLNGGFTEGVLEHYLANKNSTEFYNLMEQNGDLNTFFEFPSFYDRNDQISPIRGNETFNNNLMRYSNGNKIAYYYGNYVCDYVCPTCTEWDNMQLAKDNIYLEQCNAAGVYHDVGTGAGMPKQCYDKTHAHGTVCNIVPATMRQMKKFADNAIEHGGIYGQELIYEQMLPYIDFYQCRANGGALSTMEHARIMDFIHRGVAKKIHLFEYVYFEYGAVRLDGYTFPEEAVGDCYYHNAAFTYLNGGILEYNYEHTLSSSRKREPYASDMSPAMLEYANKCATARRTYAKGYLVYGEMTRVPDINFGESCYQYYIYRYNEEAVSTDWSGFHTVDNVVISAFKGRSTTALFFANITDSDIECNKTIDTLIYGINDGKCEVYINGTKDISQTANITNGKLNLNFNLTSRDIYMLVLS